jgi:hypothetical protein
MDDDEFWRTSRTEALLARALGVRDDDVLPSVDGASLPAVPRPTPRRDPRRWRRALVALAGAGVIVATGWAAFASARPGDGAAPPAADAPASSTTVALRASTPRWDTVLAIVPRAMRDTCVVRGRVARCAPDHDSGLDAVAYEVFTDAGALRDAYRDVAGAPRGGGGGSRCARGAGEERAWSRPGAPAVIVGRYRCAEANGVAQLWWTDEHALVLAHATGRRGTRLDTLYAWWART